MSLKFGSKTDVGRKRRNNQDSMVVVRGEALNGELDALFVIADGMGGKQGGEVASEIVIQTLPETVMAHLAARNGDKAPVDTAMLLETAVREAHRKVQQRQASDEQLSAMGTTCVAAILDANQLTIANVGDSRAYLLRGGRLKQMTQDHSSVWEQVLSGNMTPDEARTSRFRNQITRAIGSEVNARPDIYRIELEEGDSVLLCSDGLTSEVDDDEIARLLAGVADPQAACENLVEAALSAGGRDNVTVVALRYGEFSPVAIEKRALPAYPVEEALAAKNGTSRYEPQIAATDDFHELPPTVRGRRTVSPALAALLFLLAVVAGGEGYALYRMNQDLQRLRKAPPRIVALPPERPTDYELTYAPPVVLAQKPVRDAPLAVDEEGGVIAATMEGTLVRIDAKGFLTPLPEQSKLLVKPPDPPRPALLVTTDVSGNRYQVNPGSHVIWKYDAEGVSRQGSIGKGALAGPTALAVDASGNLYVIDDHVVKKIAATRAVQAQSSAEISR